MDNSNTHKIETVIYIDDSEDELFVTKLLFKRRKIALNIVHFLEFEPFIKALECKQIHDLNTTMIVVDLNLVVTSGIKAIATLRAREETKNSIIGLCTGSEDPADKAEGMRAGANFYLSKPLDITRLELLCEQVDCLSLIEKKDGSIELIKSLTSTPDLKAKDFH